MVLVLVPGSADITEVAEHSILHLRALVGIGF